MVALNTLLVRVVLPSAVTEPAGTVIVWAPCAVTGLVVNVNVATVSVESRLAVLAGVPFTFKALGVTLLGLTGSEKVMVNVVGGVATEAPFSGELSTTSRLAC